MRVADAIVPTLGERRENGRRTAGDAGRSSRRRTSEGAETAFRGAGEIPRRSLFPS